MWRSKHESLEPRGWRRRFSAVRYQQISSLDSSSFTAGRLTFLLPAVQIPDVPLSSVSEQQLCVRIVLGNRMFAFQIN